MVLATPRPASRRPRRWQPGSVGLLKKHAIHNFAGAIPGIARGVDDGHVRSNGAALLGYVPAIENTGKLDVRKDDINAAAPLQALDGVFSCGGPKDIPANVPQSEGQSGCAQPIRLHHEDNPQRAAVAHALSLPDSRMKSAHNGGVRHLDPMPHSGGTCAIERSIRNVSNRTVANWTDFVNEPNSQ